MAWTPHIYEDRPVLRERVLAAAAIGSVLIGGAMAMDTIVTGGWQWGVAAASPQRTYVDDVNQQWTEPAPSVPISQPVTLASATASDVSEQVPASGDALDGARATVSLTSYAPRDPQPPQDDAESTARFDAIEADIQQAMPQQASDDAVAAKN
ncbi:MAG: hypothetical protein QM759_17895 [Terricaulis sp.]